MLGRCVDFILVVMVMLVVACAGLQVANELVLNALEDDIAAVIVVASLDIALLVTTFKQLHQFAQKVVKL